MHQPIFFRCQRIGLPIVFGITLLFFLQMPPMAFAQSSCDCTLEIEGNGTHLLSDLIENEILPDPSSLFGFGGPCLKINGTLVIDVDYAFYGSGPNEKTEIIMAPCSQIEVKAGVFFSMDYVFMHGCETMWKGITLTDLTTFQWQGLPPGVYYLQAYAAENLLATTKLAILR